MGVVVDRVLHHFRPAVPLAIIAGGSAARGEVSYLVEPRGGGRFLSDLDLPVIVADDSEAREIQARLPALLRRLHAEEGIRAARIHVDASPISYSALRRVPPTLFWYELAHGACTLWGNKNVLAELPRRRPQELNADEGWILLNNRLIEWLTLDEASQGGVSEEVAYTVARSGTDLAKALLLIQGDYSVSTAERAEKLTRLAATSAIPGLDLRELAADVRGWTETKLRPTVSRLRDGAGLDRLGRWLLLLGSWSGHQWLGRRWTGSVEPPVFSSGPARARVRAWASFLLRANRRDGRPLVDLTTVVTWAHRLPPLWVAYRAGSQAAARRLGVADASAWPAPWSHLDREAQARRAVRLWERLALGGRHEAPIREAAQDPSEIAPAG